VAGQVYHHVNRINQEIIKFDVGFTHPKKIEVSVHIDPAGKIEVDGSKESDITGRL
jgi:hypothetical protein